MNRGQNPPAAQMNVNPKDMEDVQCECGNYVFNQVVVLKKLPALVSPSGKEGIIPMNVYACSVCNNVPDVLNEVLASWFKSADSSDDPPVEAVIQSSALPGLEPVE